MARQTDIRIRRSAVSGAIPLPANLNLGELALNTADGKAYMKKSIGGVDTVIEIGSSDPGSIYSSFEMFEYTAQVANQTTFSGADQNSNTLDYNTGSGTNLPQVQVYLNGILLDYGTDFTATNGSSVVFSVAVSAGDLIQIAAYKSNVTVTADLDLADNQKILLGDDDDLEIYHDGLKSIINDTGTGNLQFQIGGTEIFESTSDGIVLADGLDVEATEFIGDLRGSVLFKAQAGEALSKGDVVTITGISGNTTVVSKADADDASLMPAFGVAAETVSINAPVDIYSFGIMSNLTTNINGWTEGSPLYVSTIPGEMTDVPPSGSASLIQQIAKITKIHPSTGSIDITGAGRANATPNLDEGKIFVGNSSNRSVQVDDTIHVDMANSRVGINTSTPQSKLDVKLSNNTTANIGGTISVGTFAGLSFGYSEVGNSLYRHSAIVFERDDAAFGDARGNIHILNSPSGSASADLGDSRLTIVPNGNIGIGTTSPGANLHIGGQEAAAPTAGTVDRLHIQPYSNTGGPYKFKARTVSGSSDFLDMYYGSTHIISYGLNGNVGIGTTSPASKLSTVGTIRSEGMSTITGGGAGTEVRYDVSGGYGGILAYDRGNSAYKELRVEGSIIKFKESGTDVMTITGNKVGIGTTTPGAALEVLGNIILRQSASNSETVYITTNARGGGTADADLRLGNSVNGDILTIHNANVGIGTAAPASKLNVYTDAGRDFRVDHGTANRTILSTDRGMIVKAGSGYNLELDTGSDTGSIFFKDNGVTHSQFNASGNLALGTTTHFSTGGAAKLSVAGILSIGISNSDMSYIRRQSAGNYAWQTYFSNNVGTIQLQPYGGNVGIGTTSPTYKLQVSGTTYITNGFGDPNVEAAYRLKFYDNGGTYNDAGIGLDGSGGGGENMWFNALNGFYWNFGTNGKKMVLLTNGNLGIGVTVPKAKLQVEEYGIDTTTSSTAAITQVAIHTFPIADFRSAKCTIQVTNTTDSTYHITEMLMIHNGTTVSITEYGTVYTGSAAEATFDADISSTNLRLLATPATTDGMTFKVVCHSITV